MNGLKFYYKFLSPLEKKIYSDIYRGIENHNSLISVLGNMKQVKKVLSIFYIDCPELFYVDVTQNSLSGTPLATNIHVGYHKSREEAEKIKAYLDIISGRFLAEVRKKRMDNLSVVRYVHDFIIRNTAYDMDSLRRGQAYGDVSSITGVLLNQSAVCMGISLTAKWLLDKAGIPSGLIEGKMLDHNIGLQSVNDHVWNLVCINDQWYHMDITMDIGATNTKDRISYDYFLRGNMMMRKYLRFDEPYVDCMDEKGCLFARKHLIFDREEQLKRYVSECRKNKVKRMYFQHDMGITRTRVLQLVQSEFGGAIGYRINEKFQIYDIWIQ